MRKRKFLALFCCMILLLSLTACDAEGSNSASAVDTGKPAAPTVFETGESVAPSIVFETGEPVAPPPTVFETESNAEPTAPSSSAEDPLPPLGEQDVAPAHFDEVTLQWKNDDGYLFEGTFAVSDWIKYDDEDLLNATWKSVANGKTFPNITSYMPFGEEMTLTQCKRYGHLTEDIVYAVGFYKIDNITPDFSITASQPTKTVIRLYGKTLFSLLALYHNDTGATLYDITATGVMKIEDEVFTDLGAGGGFGGGLGIPINMSSDSTGIKPFVIAISISGATPNQPSPLPDISLIATEIRVYHQGYDWNTKMDSHIFTQNLTW